LAISVSLLVSAPALGKRQHCTNWVINKRRGGQTP
jgi:hypothetical protein